MFKAINGCLSLIVIIVVLQIALPKEILELTKEIVINLLEFINQSLGQLKQ